MFILRTGLQGNGKTLNSIKELDIKAAKEGRVVYYHNITGLNPASDVLKAEWIEFDDPHKWYELPLNALIVIDEAQKFFRVRPQGAAVPEYASALETMRKQGHELHCITQNPKLIDVHFRNLCNGHIHYVRGHGGSVIKRWRFETPCDIDKNKSSLERHGEATRITLDSKYFGVYKSVQDEAGHHFKFRPPRALIVFIVLCILIAVFSYRFYQGRIVKPEPVISDPVAEAQSSASVASSPSSEPELSYEQKLKPRLPDVPWSAPIYDEIRKPVAYPKPVCISTKDESLLDRMSGKMTVEFYKGRLHGCMCNTQQGTRIEVGFASCIAYIERGVFDHALADRSHPQIAAGQGGLAEARGSTPGPAASIYGVKQSADSGAGVVVTRLQSGKPGLLW